MSVYHYNSMIAAPYFGWIYVLDTHIYADRYRCYNPYRAGFRSINSDYGQ